MLQQITDYNRLDTDDSIRMPKSDAQRGKEFRERKKILAASPVEKVTKKKQKNSANSSSATAKSPSEYT
ncbi:UNVERIFIED_CONTAM: hypothetical protein NCL1_07220 [Trichonephila clavipes]